MKTYDLAAAYKVGMTACRSIGCRASSGDKRCTRSTGQAACRLGHRVDRPDRRCVQTRSHASRSRLVVRSLAADAHGLVMASVALDIILQSIEPGADRISTKAIADDRPNRRASVCRDRRCGMHNSHRNVISATIERKQASRHPSFINSWSVAADSLSLGKRHSIAKSDTVTSRGNPKTIEVVTRLILPFEVAN